MKVTTRPDHNMDDVSSESPVRTAGLPAGAGAQQLALFEPVLSAYQRHGSLSNDELYGEVGSAMGLPASTWHDKVPVGRQAEMHNLPRRSVRWVQQTLKKMGLLERTDARSVWRATPKAKDLTPAPAGSFLIAFSTNLGIGVWGRCQDFFARLNEPIHLCLTSPPYPLARPRAYGNPTVQDYTDFICSVLEPIVRNLVPGGSVVLNLSNDIFEPGSPARSLYGARLLLALHERLGLWPMDTIPWIDRTKAPGPTMWASRTRQQLNVAWEPIYWLTNDPKLCRSDNRRVLQPHTEQHRKLIERGGERRRTNFGDGANRLREGSFGRQTPGRIPRNFLEVPHRCPSQIQMRAAARAEGLPLHGASMPLKVARFFVEFLTEPGELVTDPCGGWFTTAEAAEEADRRWVVSEIMAEYARGGSLRDGLRRAAGFTCSI